MEREPRRWRALATLVARVTLALAGLGMLAWTIADSGPERIVAILQVAAPVLPVAIVLEALRVGLDALATRLVLGERGKAVPFGALYVAQLAGQGVMGVVPAGRSASEVVKGTLLLPWIEPQVAVAMGVTNQANVLISSALFSLVCLGGVVVTSPEPTLAYAVAVHFVVLFASGASMRVLTVHPRIETLLRRHFPRLASRAELFHEASREVKLFALGPIAAMFAGRAVQTVQFAALAYAVGIDVGVAEALAVQGVNLVSAALGVFVPSQVGTAELVFRFAADALRTTTASAVSLSLLSRVPQFTFVAVGLLALMTWRGRRRVGSA